MQGLIHSQTRENLPGFRSDLTVVSDQEGVSHAAGGLPTQEYAASS